MPQPLSALIVPGLLANLLGANLLLPVLQLLRPQLEQRIQAVCVKTASAGNASVAARLESPCAQLAKPTSQCLVEETAESPRSLAVLGEMVRGDFGVDSEVVVKRCLARMLGLPATSLEAIPLKELVQGFAKPRR